MRSAFKFRQALTAVFIFLFTASQTNTQESFKWLLGSPDEVQDVITPSGIRLNAGGFNFPRRKKERKSENWLRARGIAEEYISAPDSSVYDENAPDFRRFCDRLWASPDQMAEWVEEAWINSGLRIDPRTVRVIVMPGPFYVQEARQWRMSWAVGRTVYVAVVHVSLTDDGVHARVRNFRNEVAWAFASQLR